MYEINHKETLLEGGSGRAVSSREDYHHIGSVSMSAVWNLQLHSSCRAQSDELRTEKALNEAPRERGPNWVSREDRSGGPTVLNVCSML